MSRWAVDLWERGERKATKAGAHAQVVGGRRARRLELVRRLQRRGERSTRQRRGPRVMWTCRARSANKSKSHLTNGGSTIFHPIKFFLLLIKIMQL